MSISVQNISKSYASLKALDSVSFQVNRGEIFGIIGPDGAGKTTLFRILTTLLLADEGKATVTGFEVVNDYKKIRHSVGYMPGKFSLYQDLTVQENLTFFATIFGTTIHENYDLIKDIYIQIEPFKNRRAGDLSGGMKQKLALCCALIHAPKVLFLDEPTTGVDPVSRKEFWQMLKRLQQKGITILVATPYMDEASLCNRIAFLQNGKILNINEPDAIIKSYPRKIWKIKSNKIAQLISDLKKYPNTYSVFAFGEYLHYISTNNQLDENKLNNYLTQNNHQNIEISQTIPSIEDVFMDL